MLIGGVCTACVLVGGLIDNAAERQIYSVDSSGSWLIRLGLGLV